MSRHFEGAHIDEVSLRTVVQPMLSALGGRIPSTAELQKVAAQEGVDFATMLFYQAIVAHSGNKVFLEQLDRIPAVPDKTKSNAAFVVVPGWLYQDHPEWGGDGHLIKSICEASHTTCDILATGNRNLILENARIIYEYLRQHQSEKIILVSYSRSALEIRAAMEHFGLDAFAKVKAWITISANIKGSRLVDVALEGAKKIAARVICATNRIPFGGVEEMRTSHHLWQKEFTVPDHITAISIVGTPLGFHIPKYTLRNYRRLNKLGPNDGACLLTESYLRPGFIYPVWGADHFMRTPAFSPLIYRLVTYCKSLSARNDSTSS